MITPITPLRSCRTVERVARAFLVLNLAALAAPASAEVPDTLQYAIPAPPAGTQTEPQIGRSVAVEGRYTVVGAAYDDTGGADSGVVKVFDSTTGTLRFLLPNPGPAAGDHFGWSVAISGTRIVVGAYGDDTGETDAGSAYVYDLTSGSPTVPVVTLNNPRQGSGDYFGYSVAISGARIIVGAALDDTAAIDAGRAYVYDLTIGVPTVPVAVLNNPNPAAGDQFGYSVAISGTLMVVGANLDDGAGAPDAGRAYVYDLSNGGSPLVARVINNPSPELSDEFGNAVAISGNRVVIGAYKDGTGATDAGSVYVYDLNSGTALVAILNNPGPALSEYFGYSLAISGSRVLVGTVYDSTAGVFAGSAYVYDLNGDTPTVPVVTLYNPHSPASDLFGWSVAISGTRMVVGARLNDPGTTGAGGAYLYDLSSGTPTAPVAALSSPTPAAGDNFGANVAISGTRMVVGAYGDDTGATDAGSAYVYDLSTGTPAIPVATLRNPGPEVHDRFGYAVAISGMWVVVGAYQDNTAAADSGSVYVYDLSGGSPTVPLFTLNNPGPEVNDRFGYSVAISGTRVVVGAHLDDTGAADTGSVYVYDLSNGSPTVPVFTLNNPGPEVDDRFGYSVAIDGTRVVAGAYQDDTGATEAGSVYIYDLSGATPTQPAATLNNPSPSGGDNFGWSVAVSGTRLVVGTPTSDAGAPNAGVAYVYDIASETPLVPLTILENPSPAQDDYFGHSVAISGTRALAVAYRDDTGAIDAGSAYLYDLASPTPNVPVAALSNPGPEAGDWFGYSVAIDGTTVTIGAPNDDSLAADKGIAYVFAPHPDIAVEQPVGTELADGSSSALGQVLMGTSSAAVTLTVRNTGTAGLELGVVSVDGEHPGDFTVNTTGMLTSLPAGASTTFSVTFTPAALGRRSAALHIASNVTGPKNPYDIELTGTGFDPASPGNPDPLDAGFNTGGSRDVYATAVQPDGKLIIAGSFNSVQGEPRQYIARLHADGTLDMGFDPKPNSTVISVAVQADGKVLLGGVFTTLQPNGAATDTARQAIARVNADGTLDTGFDPNASGPVYSVTVQADGKVLLGGRFYALQPNGAGTATAREYIARVNCDGTVDSGFDPHPNSDVFTVAVQTDGKVLIGGYFTALRPNGAATATARQRIARLNTDGTLDTGFDPSANSVVWSVAEQADGKVLLGGYFTSLQPNGAAPATARRYIARVNADGTLDSGFDPRANSTIYSIAVQSDGKVLLGGGFTTLQPNGASVATARNYIARMNADGTLDPGFDPRANSHVLSVALQADGKVLLGGSFTTLQPNSVATPITRGGFARLLNDPATQTLSAPDPSQLLWARGGAGPELSRATFEQSTDGGVNWTLLGAGTRIGTSPNWQITGLSLPGGGQLRARGITSGGQYNGSSGLVETGGSFGIVTAPTVTGISPPGGTTAGGTRVTITGTDFTGATLVTLGGNPATDVTVVNATTITTTTPAHADGVVDVAVTTPSGTGTGAALFAYSGGPGNLDALDAGIRIGSVVYATAVQPDGKMILAGSFTSVLGEPRQNLARLHADGTLDMGFDPKPNSSVSSVAVQADGRVLLGGVFTTLQPNGAATPTARRYIARVTADGTLDAGFDPRANNSVFGVAVQADGKVLLGGSFTTLQPNGAATATARSRIARVNADGTLDAGYVPRANNSVFGVAVQADGKVLLGGDFSTLQPNGATTATARSRIARLNADGTLDAGFDPRANNSVFGVAVQADGKVLLGGNFTTLQPNGAATAAARRRIARVNANGTLDTGFDPNANGSVFSMALQADGKVLLGGSFTTLQPNGAATVTTRQRVARVHADGTLDASFDPRPNGQINSVAVQADGKILIGGRFTAFQPDNAGTRNYFARLLNDPASQTLITPDPWQAIWQRGGAAPELSRVTFELSTDEGVAWTPLGPGNRVGTTSSWRMLGLLLPADGQLRARGVTSGGQYNGSSGLIEQVAVLSYPAVTDNDGLLDSWELAYWPTTAGHGPHDDDDQDGYDNLLELAFNLNPTRPDTSVFPWFPNEDGYLTMTITKQPGVIYEAQTADTSQPDSFSAASTTVLIDDATTLKVRDNVPTATGPRRFMRAIVTGEP